MTIEPILPNLLPGGGSPNDPCEFLAETTHEVSRLLRDLVRCDAYLLSAWNPMSNSHHHYTLASDGYSQALLDHANDAYVKHNRAYALAHQSAPRSLRWRDYQRDWHLQFTETFVAQTHLIPAGYKEGSNMCLRLRDGRYTGTVYMSWTAPAKATDERREITERFHGILATVCDQLRTPRLLVETMAPDAFAMVVSLTGKAISLPNRSPGPHLGEGGALRRLVLDRIGRRLPRRFLWADDSNVFHRVTITPCRGDLSLVIVQRATLPFGLSFREIEVLHHVASGASNAGIAQRLCVSRRTASTHVEHILAKTGCLSRARLAAMAVSEGLLLGEDPSRSGLTPT